MLRTRPLAATAALLVAFAAAPVLAQKSPEDELKSLAVAPGLELSLFASEPMITNPAAIDIDTHGRVWVAEIQWYRRAAKDPPADQIKVLEDTDGDGRADKSTVFADDVFAPMSLCVAGDKVYVATSPDLWVYEDKNGDLKADGPPKKLLTGFGGKNHDHGAHSLVLGPDHKWWMAHGDAGYDVTGVDGSKIGFPAGGMIRGELDGTKLENVATNFRNPYEIAVSSFGEAFCSDNDNDGNFSVRICWILEGGNYGWYKRPGPKFPPGTPYGETWHFRGAIPGFVPSTLVTGFGSPCGMCYYEGDALPDLKNMPLHCDAGPREVRAYPHKKAGAGFKATQKNLITSTDDNYFRPDDICAAPDGSLYVADWYDGGVGGHAYNNPNQGRIFRLTAQGSQPARKEKPGPYTTIEDAILGLQSPNLATQYLAREKLLAKGEAAVTALIELTKGATDPNHAARALWVLDRIGGGARQEVVEQLASDDPATQALAVRVLRRHNDDAEVAAAFEKLATSDDIKPEAWRELMLYYAKRQEPESLNAVVSLAARVPKKDRYAVETVNIAAAGRKSEVAKALLSLSEPSTAAFQLLPVLAIDGDEIVQGSVATFALASPGAPIRLTLIDQIGVALHEKAMRALIALATDHQVPPTERQRAVEWLTYNCAAAGLWSGVVGTPDASVSAWIDYKVADPAANRAKLVAATKQLFGESAYQAAAIKLASAANLTELGPELLSLVAAKDTTPDVRALAIAAAVQTRPDGADDAFVSLLKSNDAQLRNTAAGALVDLGQFQKVKSLVVKGADAKQAGEIVKRLVATTGGALALLKWIDSKELDDTTAKLAVGQAINHPDANVRILFEKFVPENERPQRLGAAMKAEDILKLAGDAARGEQIFHQSSAANCKGCHAVRGFGKKLGPDLTSIGKKYEKAALLETIMDPSKAISHEYVTYVVETDEGQSYTGFVVDKNDKVVIIRTAEDKAVRIPAKHVDSLTATTKSMMPELVLREVTAQDAADLLAYLMTLREPLPQ
ncbi:MAG: c-type cytochrome [Planctomycetaceae bacterium]|nr:c-type cytochrome [Planctomycetaceae bacterium]